MTKILSKTKYVTGLQCPKLLWLEINDPEKISDVDLATQFIFDQGHLVGEYLGNFELTGYSKMLLAYHCCRSQR